MDKPTKTNQRKTKQSKQYQNQTVQNNCCLVSFVQFESMEEESVL
jgi:hypothetical protein